jgi:hypothetical protein
MGELMQHSVAAGGHSSTLAGHWRAADEQLVAGRHRASATLRCRIAGIAVTVLIGLALVIHAGWLVLTHTSAASQPYPPFERTQRPSAAAADDWIRANVPAGTHLLVAGFDPPAGYQPVTLETAGSNWKNYNYLVTSTTSDQLADSALTTVWRSSTPVAIFSDVEVRYVLARTSPDAIRSNHDTDRVERLQAGAALQENPHLMSSPGAKDMLAAGQLDLRAAAVLTALVTQVPFALTEVVVVAPEAAAEMPARSITVNSSDPAGFTRALSGVVTSMAPDQVTVGENGAIGLHWPLSVTPMPSVNDSA